MFKIPQETLQKPIYIRVLTSRYTCVSLSKGYEWIAMYGNPPFKNLRENISGMWELCMVQWEMKNLKFTK